eukprot:gene25333-10990_t
MSGTHLVSKELRLAYTRRRTCALGLRLRQTNRSNRRSCANITVHCSCQGKAMQTPIQPVAGGAPGARHELTGPRVISEF